MNTAFSTYHQQNNMVGNESNQTWSMGTQMVNNHPNNPVSQYSDYLMSQMTCPMSWNSGNLFIENKKISSTTFEHQGAFHSVNNNLSMFKRLLNESNSLDASESVTSLSLKSIFNRVVSKQNMVAPVKKRPVVVLKNNLEPSTNIRKSSTSLSTTSKDKQDTDVEENEHSSSHQSFELKLGEKSIVGENKVNSTISQQSPTSPESPSNSNAFNVRLDVVRKTIFRAMKKFYVQDFKSFFDFTQRKRKLNPNFGQEIFEKAKEYASKTFGVENCTDAAYFIVALIDTKQKYLQSDNKFTDLGNQINSLLRSFNTKKSKALLKYKQFSVLILYFLNNQENIDELMLNKDKECQNTYQTQIDILKGQAGASVAAQ